MRNKFVPLLLIFLLIITFPCFSYAEEQNQKLDQYNQQLQEYEKQKTEIEQRNNLINQKYNIPAQIAAEKNASNEVSIDNSYKIQQATEKTGNPVSVIIEHIFTGSNGNQTKSFTIDENDEITFLSFQSIAEKANNSSYFYNKTDENHLQGYWILAMLSCTSNAIDLNMNWNNGIQYVGSFREGSTHPDEKMSFEMSFTYIWKALQTYALEQLPEAPKKPEDKIEVEEKVLSLTQEQKQERNESSSTHRRNNVLIQQTKNISNIQTPSFTTLEDNQIPLVGGETKSKNTIEKQKRTYWSLINLIIVALSLFITILSYMLLFADVDQEKINKIIKKKNIFKRVVNIVISIVLCISFILLEDTQGIMTMTDKYTISMLILFFFQLLEVVTIRCVVYTEKKYNKGR